MNIENAGEGTERSVVAGERYLYAECGLDDIWLCNGFSTITTEWGEAVAVENPEGLHRVIGQSIADGTEPLTGQQLKFLRVQLDLSQTQLGQIMGHADRQTIANWERDRDKPIVQGASIITRLLYTEYLKGGNASSITAMVGRIAEANRQHFVARRMQFQNCGGTWELLARDCA